MSFRERMRVWLLTDEERLALGRAVWEMEFERQKQEIKQQRELIEHMEKADLNDWEQANPVVHIYFEDKPNEGFFRISVDAERRTLESLEEWHEHWIGL